MMLAGVCHWILIALFGLGWLPSIVARKCALTHLDWILETVIYRLMEQVRRVCIFGAVTGSLKQLSIGSWGRCVECAFLVL